MLEAPVEVAVPDRESAGMLMDRGSGFRAELVEGADSAAVVRPHPPEAGSAGWVSEVLALVERWLEPRRLPVASLHHDDRVYVIPASTPDRGRTVGGDPHGAA